MAVYKSSYQTIYTRKTLDFYYPIYYITFICNIDAVSAAGSVNCNNVICVNSSTGCLICLCVAFAIPTFSFWVIRIVYIFIIIIGMGMTVIGITSSSSSSAMSMVW